MVAPPMSIKTCIGWVRMNKYLNVLMYTGHMESPNWVASCFEELDDTLPHFQDVKWDSVRAIHVMSAEAYAWKMALGRGKTRPCFLVTSWIVATRGSLRACVCHIVRFVPLQGWLLMRISATLSEMSDGMFAAPKRCIINFIILWWELYGLMTIL
jgi:hypothetical protein